MSKTLVLKPRLSEQTYALASAQRVYVFDVPKDANKHEVARAVAAQFDVTVEAVNVTTLNGKVKRTISLTGRRRSNRNGVRSDIKKAYVRLAKGFSLPVFAALEETEQQEQALQEKIDKSAAKQNEKDAKESKPARRGLHLLKKEGKK